LLLFPSSLACFTWGQDDAIIMSSLIRATWQLQLSD